jgi:hypothetical protein
MDPSTYAKTAEITSGRWTASISMSGRTTIILSGWSGMIVVV